MGSRFAEAEPFSAEHKARALRKFNKSCVNQSLEV